MHAVGFLNGEQIYTSSRIYESAGPFTVKISRSKGVATFSVKEGGQFVERGALRDFYTGSGVVSLLTKSFEPDYPAVLSSFDNFVLELL